MRAPPDIPKNRRSRHGSYFRAGQGYGTPADCVFASALVAIAGAVAATDPDRAERIAQSITYDSWKASALAAIAGALAATDPGR